ncbi:uncharacterized protein MEPE_06510 [Melanopsichium pennsylvanicum]|uniref:SAM-dependent MTase RsmB/NOP-type domain-containing protein n=2 Tax=Melanopsichium pennsylvanicum TaxID=63383 RepID=A0AAJ4XSI3_9BASI|nr:conserved hypothetical protein [Melanopsichium pennsylvanicum 4]SNX87799.1 uncharacterized protein MEPE_06510 [Melanopsichium pennsylvanicum]
MADFYIRSAASLDRVLRDECSVKAAAAAHSDSGRVLAVLINSLAYRTALMIALEDSKVIKAEAKVFTLSSPTSKGDNGKGKAQDEDSSKKKKDKNKKPWNKYGHKKETRVWPSKEAFLLVLAHDLLFQNRGIQAAKTWPPKVTLERYKPSLHSSLVKQQLRQKLVKISDLRSGALYQEMVARMPRWVRINPLRATAAEVHAWLAENRFVRLPNGTEEITGLKEYVESQHVPGLLAFHPKATSGLLAGEMYKGNWVVLQDLASCFPAYILNPPGNAQVIDATSAPGNKSSHVSAIMYSKSLATTSTSSFHITEDNEDGEKDSNARGNVFAFERDTPRYKTLTKRLAAVGALRDPKVRLFAATGNVIPERKDFLTTDPQDFVKVTHMLVDPSCSGSGIVNRLDFLKEDDDVEDQPPPCSPNASSSLPRKTTLKASLQDETQEEEEGEGGGAEMSKLEKRLKQLSEFQLLMVRHAFKFVNLQKVVYSTCSIHAQENENVVIRALDTPEAKENGWVLAPRRDVIPSWPVRGDAKACGGDKIVADSVIRCVPGGVGEGDKPHVESCNGFFVACFVKKGKNGAEGLGKRARQGSADNVEDADDAEEEQEENIEQNHEGEKVKLATSGGNRLANRKKKLQKKRKKQRLQHEQQQS